MGSEISFTIILNDLLDTCVGRTVHGMHTYKSETFCIADEALFRYHSPFCASFSFSVTRKSLRFEDTDTPILTSFWGSVSWTCLKVVHYHMSFCCCNSLKRKRNVQIRPVDFIVRILNSIRRNFTGSIILSTGINQTTVNYMYGAESFFEKLIVAQQIPRL
jgi:hypothetical protein